MRVGVWVKLDICIYHEGSLSVRNEFNLGDSWHHQTFHGASQGSGEGRHGVGARKDVCLFAMNSISVIAGITKRFMAHL